MSSKIGRKCCIDTSPKKTYRSSDTLGKILNNADYQGNENRNVNELSPHTSESEISKMINSTCKLVQQLKRVFGDFSNIK